MPRKKRSDFEKVRSYAQEFTNLKQEKTTLICTVCEKGYMTLPAALEKLKKVESTLTHPVGFEKLQNVFQKNTGLLELRELKEAFEIGRGIDSARAIRVSEWTVEERVAVLKNCPIHAADVERSFSLLNNVLTEKRTKLTEETIKYLFFLVAILICEIKFLLTIKSFFKHLFSTFFSNFIAPKIPPLIITFTKIN